MSFITFLRDLFIGDYRFDGPPATKVSVPMPPVQPPKGEPSCFARGIARSIVEEPDQWETMRGSGYYTSDYCSVFCVRHRVTGVWLTGDQCRYTDSRGHAIRLAGCLHLSTLDVAGGECLDRIDQQLVAQTIEAHPIGQLKERLEEERAEEARKTAAKEHFVKLGCPDTTTSPTAETTTQ